MSRPSSAGTSTRARRPADGILVSAARSGEIWSETTGRFPTRVVRIHASLASLAGSGLTHFGLVASGEAVVEGRSGTFRLGAGMYFALPTAPGDAGGWRIDARLEDGSVWVVSSLHHVGLFLVGGPVESTGRLRYIDGCTDSVLVPPVVRGDPCLNLLHVPPGTHQTSHRHPSLRAGLVLRGEGRCVAEEGEHPLVPGRAFVIPENAVHSFHTGSAELLIVAYHPDSDSGPSDEDHPMLNRTLVNGRSAAHPARRPPS